MITAAHNNYQQQIQNKFQKDPKAFWNYAKSKRGSRNKQTILKNGVELSDDECAREFAEYFYSVYSSKRADLNVEAAITAAGIENGAGRVHLDRLLLDDIQNSLQRLKPKSSAGPDGIPPYIFRDCRSVLSGPLLYIYNLSLKHAVFPEKWKLTRVVPVPKGNSKSQVEGYRPVAVLSTIAKVFESAIHKAIYEQVKAQLSEAQHGFRPKRSTTSNLLSHMVHVVPTVDSGGQVDSAYFDFKKAFDLVDNDVLLTKLAAVGFTPHLLKFFASYMRDRQQYVEYAGRTSQPYYTRSGVSQGSNLGPLAFILMINDLPKTVKYAKCLLFADDLKLSLAITNELDCNVLQEDIHRVVTWSRQNRLQFNISKCQTITFSRSRKPVLYDYKVDDTPMTRVKEVRDLGVSLNSGLVFRDHIVNCCKKAFRNLGFTLRTVHNFTNIKVIIVLYNALVRSQLECNAVIWSPHETKYSIMLERVQNKFIRYLYMRYYGVYPFYPLMYPTLFLLGMVGYNELRVRRELALVSYMFKVFRGVIHNADLLEQVGMCVPDRYVWRRLRPQLLAVPRARTNLLGEAPLTRALRTLNLIANKIDLFCCSLSVFEKTALHIISYKTE